MVSSEVNCLPLDLTTILTVSSTNKTKTKDTITNIYIDMLCTEDNSFLENDLINDNNIVDTI